MGPDFQYPTNPTGPPRPWVPYLLGLGLLGGVVILYLSIQSFYGIFYMTRARYEARDPETNEKFLRRAVEHDPASGRANVELARIMDKPGSYGAALDHLQRGMLTYRPVSTYLQLGRLLHRIGGRNAEARNALEAAVRMNPGNVRAMEQLALVAISEGASTEVQRWTDAVRNRDFSNLNAIYIRARDAERLGNRTGARTLYQQISAALPSSEKLPPGTLFTADIIRRSLTEQTPNGAARP